LFVSEQADDKIKSIASFENSGCGDALDSSFEVAGHVFGSDSEPCHRVAVIADREQGNLDLLFNGQINHARDALHAFARALRHGAQCAEMFAKDFHGDVRACAGKHVVDAVRDRLADGDVEAGDHREILAQCGKELRFGAVLHGERNFEFRGLHTLGVLIEFGAAGAAAHGGDFGKTEERLFNDAGEFA
jgi:hypothetical protein